MPNLTHKIRVFQSNESYTKIKRIGKGGYGSVYLVQRKASEELLILKEIDVNFLSEEEAKKADNEALLLMNLEHKNIIKFEEVFKVVKGPKTLNIITEFCSNGDLHKKLMEKIEEAENKAKEKEEELKSDMTLLLENSEANATMPYFQEQTLVTWFVQICHALQYMHEKHIIHRDIKPHNLFLDNENNVKIGDFGISKDLGSSLKLAKTVTGTLFYLAPEIINEGEYDTKADMWSLGVTFYQLITGKLPYEGSSLPNTLLKISTKQFKPIENTLNFSQDFIDLILSLLEKDPKSRPSAKEILDSAFVQCFLHKEKDSEKTAPNSKSTKNNNDLLNSTNFLDAFNGKESKICINFNKLLWKDRRKRTINCSNKESIFGNSVRIKGFKNSLSKERKKLTVFDGESRERKDNVLKLNLNVGSGEIKKNGGIKTSSSNIFTYKQTVPDTNYKPTLANQCLSTNKINSNSELKFEGDFSVENTKNEYLKFQSPDQDQSISIGGFKEEIIYKTKGNILEKSLNNNNNNNIDYNDESVDKINEFTIEENSSSCQIQIKNDYEKSDGSSSDSTFYSTKSVLNEESKTSIKFNTMKLKDKIKYFNEKEYEIELLDDKKLDLGNSSSSSNNKNNGENSDNLCQDFTINYEQQEINAF